MKQKDLLYEYMDTAPPAGTAFLDDFSRKRILSDALAKAGLTKTKTTKPKRVWTLLVAAMLTLCCVTAVAAEKFRLDDAFLEWMGFPAQMQVEQLEHSGSVIGQSVTSEDITITIEGTVGDRHSAFVFFTVQLPESYEMPAPTYGDTTWFWFGNYSLYTERSGSQGYHIEMLAQEENTLRFFLSLDNWNKLPGETIALTLSELKVIVGEDSFLVAEGPWQFSFPMEYTDNSIKLPFSGTIKPVENSELQLKEIRVSPLSLQLEFTRPLRMLWEKKHRDTHALLNMPITLCFADGSEITDEMMMDSSSSAQGFSVQLIRKYRRLIDLSQLTEIRIGAYTVSVKS